MQSKDFLSADKAGIGGTDDLSALLAGIADDITALQGRVTTGTFDPVWRFDSGSWDAGSNTQGKWTRIGDLVIATFRIETTTTSSSPSGAARLGGLPFNIINSSSTKNPAAVQPLSFGTNWPSVAVPYVDDEVEFLIMSNSAAPVALAATHMVAGDHKNSIVGSVTYYTDDP